MSSRTSFTVYSLPLGKKVLERTYNGHVRVSVIEEDDGGAGTTFLAAVMSNQSIKVVCETFRL